MTDTELMKIKINQDIVGRTKLTINGIEMTAVMNYALRNNTKNNEIPTLDIELAILTSEVELFIEKNNLKLHLNDSEIRKVYNEDLIDDIISSVEENNSVDANPLTLKHKLKFMFKNMSVFWNDV